MTRTPMELSQHAPVALRAGTITEAFAITVAAYRDDEAVRHSDGTSSMTWGELDRRVREVAGGLRAIGVGAGNVVALMLTNRVEAGLADLAVLHLGAVPVSFYNSTPAGQLTYLLEDSGARVVITEPAFAEVLLAARQAAQTDPGLVLVGGSADREAGPGDIAFDELTGLGTPLAVGEEPAREPHDLVSIVYTSGTTGPPKGVELTHDNVLAQIRGLQEIGRLPDRGRVLSYLPFAHLGDRLCSYYMPIVMSATIIYHADGRTALNALPAARSTLFMTVPRIWRKIQVMMEQGIAALPEPRRAETLAGLAIGGRVHDARAVGRPPDARDLTRWRPYLNGPLKQLRVDFGFDDAELLYNGAAPLAPETLRFFAAAGIDICESYGQTESAGIILCNPRDAPRPNRVGIPVPGVEMRVAEDGELLVRGPVVMAGYRNKPELTAATVDPDGWLATGDIVSIDEHGYYSIVDRKKEIIVNSAGKNMSPAMIENTISAESDLIAVAVCIGDGQPHNTMLVTADPGGAAALTGEPGLPAAVADPRLAEALRGAVQRANTRLSGPERVRRFAIVPEIWLPGGDALTPTSKVRRRDVNAKYAEIIKSLYGGAPVPGVPVVDVPLG